MAPVSGLRVLRGGYGSSGAEEVERLEDELLEKIKLAGYAAKHTDLTAGLNLDDLSRASTL